ncbi:uncharacterized protein ASCRUDRAFT_75975 [Ascoidea rubescens DSM 1968]|uniref:Uncharacterized protein n=1 Tax=Ascoidea rubescens DSM 1968 TaxID=1344418 RepID=A0A1D2VI51_9ASCO|nr:hypothetical protein ASCRUDRAFT_75975 [Ascoidea rubescens DSM 1968]ODV61285.1 hypothetical protein ASCRUDRAFT_75975 [Ascoidea rubescens DSM 1968]
MPEPMLTADTTLPQFILSDTNNNNPIENDENDVLFNELFGSSYKNKLKLSKSLKLSNKPNQNDSQIQRSHSLAINNKSNLNSSNFLLPKISNVNENLNNSNLQNYDCYSSLNNENIDLINEIDDDNESINDFLQFQINELAKFKYRPPNYSPLLSFSNQNLSSTNLNNSNNNNNNNNISNNLTNNLDIKNVHIINNNNNTITQKSKFTYNNNIQKKLFNKISKKNDITNTHPLSLNTNMLNNLNITPNAIEKPKLPKVLTETALLQYIHKLNNYQSQKSLSPLIFHNKSNPSSPITNNLSQNFHNNPHQFFLKINHSTSDFSASSNLISNKFTANNIINDDATSLSTFSSLNSPVSSSFKNKRKNSFKSKFQNNHFFSSLKRKLSIKNISNTNLNTV